ncbi:MAG: hypothetical protein KF760_28865 [Candidatus Eremiobacteraeota bacterium]|nr:hypothetical protein [Candidatus Eremiobacteraeota bacterium]MCW5865910.1 hypothetical protein [Candidatus Eremiobacteraeota bacterium]
MLKYLLAGLLLAGAVLPSDTLESQGRRWTYYSVSPSAPGEPPPLILLFHGTGGSGGGFLDRSGWAETARREGLVVVAPSGQTPKPEEKPAFLTNPRAWNVGQAFFKDSTVDDQAFVCDLAGKAVETFHADPRRVYLVGHSNGAAFCSKLAASYSERWAGIGCVAGPILAPSARLSRPVATCCVFGMEDPLLPVAGGKTETPWGSRVSTPVGEMLSHWGRALGYEGIAEVVSDDDAQRTERYGDELEVIYLKGHGHNYPSPTQPLVDPRFGPVRLEVPVNERIWDFLKNKKSPGLIQTGT